MCGIFGTLRPRTYSTDTRRSAAGALISLGFLAQERGIDSAGLATVHTRTLKGAHPTQTAGVTDRTVLNARIVHALGAFADAEQYWTRLTPYLRSAWAVLGHTRWATQGSVTLDNASPMLVGPLLGTHNGDVATPFTYRGGTDTAWLYRQLTKAPTRRTRCAVLTALRGRAALAWTDLNAPGTVNLARTALSPLYVTTDAAGAIWWASNPEWLRLALWQARIDADFPEAIEEGRYIELHQEPDHIGWRETRFIPTCRPIDVRIADIAAWRGFTAEDRHAAIDSLRHRVAR